MALEEEDLPDGNILTGACGGLIIVDRESHTIRAVHYTAQQYFDRSCGKRLMEAKLNLTKISLTYFLLPNFSSGICATDSSIFQRLQIYPFLDYAAKHWGSEGGDLNGDLFWPSLQGIASNSTAIAITYQVCSLQSVR